MYTSEDIAEAIEKIPADTWTRRPLPGVTCTIG
jgi:hypothetical protein